MLGRQAVKTWSSTQPGVSLSSGEAEFNGVVRGAGMGLGFQSLMADLGYHLRVRVWCDSSAAIGVCSRQGLGKLRHLDTHTLWVQQAIRSKKIDLRKIKGEANPADLLTKHLLSRERLGALVRKAGCTYRTGRSEAAPQVRTTQLGKQTMAEAHAIEEYDAEDAPIMPHIDCPKEIDVRYPPLQVPDEVPEVHERLMDLCDPVFQHGMSIARTIAEDTIVHGRRRVDVVQSKSLSQCARADNNTTAD